MDLSQGLGNINAGPWVAECRTLKLEGAAWLDSNHLRSHLTRCYKAAQFADDEPSRGRLIELERAVKLLEREVAIYANALGHYRDSVSYLVADIIKARTTFVPPDHPNGGFEVMDLDTFVARVRGLHSADE